MQPPDNACGDHFPIFDEGAQALRLEYKTDSIMRRPRIAARKERKKTLCARIHPQGVPMPVQYDYGIGLKLRHEKLDCAARRFCLGCVEIRCVEMSCAEIGVTIEWSVARCQQQRVALAQRNLKGLGQT